MLPIVILACRVLEPAIRRTLPPEVVESVRYLDYGLHRVPTQLAGAVQEALEEIEEPSLVVVGYGLCGTALRGIVAGKHTLLVPRTDDCIALVLGSYQAYAREFAAAPGTYYLTSGWLESGSHPLKEYEEYLPTYGEKQALWLLDQQYRNYERVALVASTDDELAALRARALEVARFCERWDMRYEEITGSDDYVRRLVDTAFALRRGALRPEDAGPDFLVIPPGHEIRLEMYAR